MKIAVVLVPFWCLAAAAVGGFIGYNKGFEKGSSPAVMEYKEIQARQASFDEGFELGKSMIFYCGRDKEVGFMCWQRTSVKMEVNPGHKPPVLKNGTLELKHAYPVDAYKPKYPLDVEARK